MFHQSTSKAVSKPPLCAEGRKNSIPKLGLIFLPASAARNSPNSQTEGSLFPCAHVIVERRVGIEPASEDLTESMGSRSLPAQL
jgi:hypothetical protein